MPRRRVPCPHCSQLVEPQRHGVPPVACHGCRRAFAGRPRDQRAPLQDRRAAGQDRCHCGLPKGRTATQCRRCDFRSRRPDGSDILMTRDPWSIPAALRAAVYARDGDVCWLCGTYVDRLCGHNDECAPTVDHVVPRKHGGPHTLDNLRTAHRSCNGRRGAPSGV